MIGARGIVKADFNGVRRAVRTANIKSLKAAGAYIRGAAMRRIKRSKRPSLPGQSPHTAAGRLKRSIAFDAGTTNVLIGPTASGIGRVGALHEMGGIVPPSMQKKRRANNWKIKLGGHGPISIQGNVVGFAKLRTGRMVAAAKRIAPQAETVLANGSTGKAATRHYPARPFMRPALESARPYLPAIWRDSVGG